MLFSKNLHFFLHFFHSLHSSWASLWNIVSTINVSCSFSSYDEEDTKEKTRIVSLLEGYSASLSLLNLQSRKIYQRGFKWACLSMCAILVNSKNLWAKLSSPIHHHSIWSLAILRFPYASRTAPIIYNTHRTPIKVNQSYVRLHLNQAMGNLRPVCQLFGDHKL